MKTFKQYAFNFALLVMLGFTVFSCSNESDDPQIPEDAQLSQTEVQTVLDVEDLNSSVDVALAELFNSETNSLKASASKNDCYTAEYTDSGFTATFNNCQLNGTDNINGTVVVTYNESAMGASYSATYTDFYIGTTKVNGTRTFILDVEESEMGISYKVTSDISVELENGEVISETGTKTLALVFEEGEDTLFHLSGTWTIIEGGDTYVLSGDIYKQLNCEYWTSGILNLSKNGLAVDLDFGDGSCDNKATIIYPNGATQEIDL